MILAGLAGIFQFSLNWSVGGAITTPSEACTSILSCLVSPVLEMFNWFWALLLCSACTSSAPQGDVLAGRDAKLLQSENLDGSGFRGHL